MVCQDAAMSSMRLDVQVSQLPHLLNLWSFRWEGALKQRMLNNHRYERCRRDLTPWITAQD